MDESAIWGFGSLLPLLLPLVIGVLVSGVVSRFRNGTTVASDVDADRAMELDRDQYARGEIRDEAFEEGSETSHSEGTICYLTTSEEDIVILTTRTYTYPG